MARCWPPVRRTTARSCPPTCSPVPAPIGSCSLAKPTFYALVSCAQDHGPQLPASTLRLLLEAMAADRAWTHAYSVLQVRKGEIQACTVAEVHTCMQGGSLRVVRTWAIHATCAQGSCARVCGGVLVTLASCLFAKLHSVLSTTPWLAPVACVTPALGMLQIICSSAASVPEEQPQEQQQTQQSAATSPSPTDQLPTAAAAAASGTTAPTTTVLDQLVYDFKEGGHTELLFLALLAAKDEVGAWGEALSMFHWLQEVSTHLMQSKGNTRVEPRCKILCHGAALPVGAFGLPLASLREVATGSLATLQCVRGLRNSFRACVGTSGQRAAFVAVPTQHASY